MSHTSFIILIEQSYIDSNIKSHMMKFFFKKYGIIYKNRSYGQLPGNLGSLIGKVNNNDIPNIVSYISSDLEKYRPFIKLLGICINGYWMSKSYLNKLSAFIQMKSTFAVCLCLYPTLYYNQLVDCNTKSIIFSLEFQKNKNA